MKNLSKTTVLTLSNSIELATEVISELAGGEVGNSINGQVLKGDELRDLVAIRTQTTLSNNLKVRS